MNKKMAREIGAALGLVKSGAVEAMEAKNVGMVKIANAIHRLYKKGKLKKGSRMEKVAIDWGSAGAGAAGGASIGAGLGMLGGPLAPLTSGAGALIGGGIGGLGGMLFGKDKPAAQPKAMGQEAGGFSPTIMEKLKSALSPEELAQITGRGAAKPAAGGGSWSGSDKDFYTEKPDDIRNMWMKYMGMTPGQMQGRQSAMLAGLGRAWQGAETGRWLRAMTSGVV